MCGIQLRRHAHKQGIRPAAGLVGAQAQAGFAELGSPILNSKCMLTSSVSLGVVHSFG